MLAVPEEPSLARRPRPVSLRQLTGVPLITYAQMREVHSIENRLGRRELRDQIVFRSHDNATILGLAAEGVGAAIISWLSVDPHRPGLRLKRLARSARASSASPGTGTATASRPRTPSSR